MKLTKTDYLIYRDCAKNAWIKIHKPDVYHSKPMSQFDLTIIETGNKVDVLARKLFPNGVLLPSQDSATQTKEFVDAQEPILYQPVFETEKYKMISDIMMWNKDVKAYDVFEVKASNSGEDKKAKDELYTHDLAFQYAVLKDLKVPTNKLYLIRLNSEYVRGTDLVLNELFTREDFTDRVLESVDTLRAEMKNAYDLLSSSEEPSGACVCMTRGRSAHCTTFEYSNPQVPKYSVHDISRIGSSKKKLAELVDSDTLSIQDVQKDFDLSDTQRNQVDVAQSGKTIIKPEELKDFLSQIKYPISFLDYETFASGIPRFVGYSPFNQIPFQFSLHIFNESDKEPTHTEFLFTDTTNPDIAFIKALQDNLPDTGSIIVWNKSFEIGINTHLGERNPEYEDFLESVNTRVIDLIEPFAKQLFVHEGFKGKTSIKFVLPTLVPTLSYKELDISEGATASDTWNKIVADEYSKEEAEEKVEQLRTYCKLDTYAMFAIWDYLIKLI
ncbi:MAG: DUF2779 domain-containing protein [Bacteroidota bacterium]